MELKESITKMKMEVGPSSCQDSPERLRFPPTMQVLLHRATNRTIPSFVSNNVADTVSNLVPTAASASMCV
jgi:hypothetical protein